MRFLVSGPVSSKAFIEEGDLPFIFCIESGFYCVIDRLVGGGGPGFLGKEHQDVFDFRSLTATGMEHADAD
jgi:hypothetical protein